MSSARGFGEGVLRLEEEALDDEVGAIVGLMDDLARERGDRERGIDADHGQDETRDGQGNFCFQAQMHGAGLIARRSWLRRIPSICYGEFSG